MLPTPRTSWAYLVTIVPFMKVVRFVFCALMAKSFNVLAPGNLMGDASNYGPSEMMN